MVGAQAQVQTPSQVGIIVNDQDFRFVHCVVSFNSRIPALLFNPA
jgi:hypothetical protein